MSYIYEAIRIKINHIKRMYLSFVDFKRVPIFKIMKYLPKITPKNHKDHI